MLKHLLLLLLLAGCGPEKKALRQDRREEATLTQLAELYWSAVRWNDVSAAAACVPEEERASFEAWLTGWQKDERLTEATLLRVQLGKKMEPPQSGRVREAVVTLKTEGYSTTDQVLRAETITQRWYRDEHGWYVEWP